MLGISCQDATQGTKGRKRCFSNLSNVNFQTSYILMFSGGKGGDKPKPKDDKKGGGGGGKGGKEGGKKGK